MTAADEPLRFGYVTLDDRHRNRPLVLKELETLGWQRVSGGSDWDLLWYSHDDPAPAAYRELQAHQRINHIPGIQALANKAQLYRHLCAFARQGAAHGGRHEFGFVPKTYLIPQETHAFAAELAANPGKLWILKPVFGSWGRDIRLITDALSLPRSGTWIVQAYIDDPLTYHGRKLNLRVFVLVTSVAPFEIYLYDNGYVDLASEPYCVDPDKLDNPYIHNTNSGVQLRRPGVAPADCWLDIKRWRRELRAGGVDDARLWDACRRLIVTTVLSAQSALATALPQPPPHPRNCFELLGLDLMFDRELRAYLIECNRSPSMTTSQSRDIKVALIHDLLGVLGFARGTRPARQPAAARDMAAGGFECIYPGAEDAGFSASRGST